MRKQISVILILFLLTMFTMPIPAFADTLGPKTPPPPPDKTQAVAPTSTLYLSSWSSSIARQGSNTVLLSGYSEANVPVNQIWVILYLQRWNGSQWVTISGGYRATGYSTVSITGQQILAVTPGYYYRTTADHQCYHNGVYDPSQPAVSTSGYTYVD